MYFQFSTMISPIPNFISPNKKIPVLIFSRQLKKICAPTLPKLSAALPETRLLFYLALVDEETTNARFYKSMLILDWF